MKCQIDCSNDSLLVVTAKGALIRLRCPFAVTLIREVPELVVGDIYFVQLVKVDKQGMPVFFILSRPYSYSNFSIL